MISTLLLRTTLAMALLAAGAAQAGTVQFNGWAYNNGNHVALVHGGSNPATSVQAGSFDVHLSGFTGTPALNGDFDAYCVELTQTVGLNSRNTDYSLVAAGSYFDAGKLAALTRLVGFVDHRRLMDSASNGFKDDQSTAVQLAIWNIVYDTDNTLAYSAGAAFSEAPTASRTDYQASRANSDGTRFVGADALLAGAASFAAGSGYQLYVLRSASAQDQLIVTRGTVPEPSSVALVALALAGAGFAARRRG